MTDPMDSLRGLQSALDSGAVRLQQFQPCVLHPDVSVMLDSPAPGCTRFTYAKLVPSPEHDSRRCVHGIALFIVTEPIDGVACFQTGYAVAESARRKGLATALLQQGIDELTFGMSRTPVAEFYVEAVVGADNVASNKIAARVLSATPEAIKDEDSGEEAFQYLLKVRTRA
jgi:hypothetical protein